jgi:DNA-binding MarR family transcriptional regulator
MPKHDVDLAVDGEQFFGLLAMSFRTAVDRLHRRLAAAGFDDLRPAHGFAFSRLNPSGATASELAEHLGVTKQAAGQMIDFLEEHDYVKRESHPSDRRVKLITLAPRGRECVELAIATKNDIVDDWGRLAGSRQLAAAKDALSAILTEEDLPHHRGLRPVW